MALRSMPVRDRVVFAILLWALLEAAAFSAVVAAIGLGGAILVGLLTSLLGAVLAKRVGRQALGQIRRGFGSGAVRGLPVEGALAGIGALLLLLPGFLTDLFGLALAFAPVRAVIARRIRRGGTGRGAPAQGPASIDLEPGEWRPADEARRAVPKR